MTWRIRELRKARGWTQEQLAHESGEREATISVLENDKGNPRYDTLQAIAAALNVSVVDLFADDGSDPSVREIFALLSLLPRSERDALLTLVRRIAGAAEAEH